MPAWPKKMPSAHSARRSGNEASWRALRRGGDGLHGPNLVANNVCFWGVTLPHRKMSAYGTYDPKETFTSG